MASEIPVHCLYDALVPISELKLNPKNRNKHPATQIDHLARIMKHNGIRRSVIVSKRSGLVVVGHGRIQAMERLGMKNIPVQYQDYASENEEYSDAIADNAIALQAELDLSGINQDVPDLGPDFGIDLLGIKDFVLDLVEKLEPQCDEDEVPEHVEPRTKLGDIYHLGRHRLMCGDSTNPENIQNLLDGNKVELVFTDPPYRMKVEGGSNQIGKKARKLGKSIAHLCDFDPNEFLNSIPLAFESGCMNAYIFCNKDLVPDYLNWAIEAGYSFNILFWKKPNPIPMGDSHRPDVEYLLLFRKSATWNNGLDGVNYSKCLEFGRDRNKEHPTVKPVEMIENEIRISSSHGGKIMDFFGGSGSTLIACEKTNRQCYMMELDPKYCDVIVARWEKYTGKKAELITSEHTNG